MLINFMNKDLVEVKCDCLNLDGHPVSNLIEVNKFKRSKGFLADRFIKAPVHITLKFKCNVDVQKIVVNPRVGSQKSCGFEIMKVFRDQTTTTVARTVIETQVENLVFSKSGNESGGVPFWSPKAAESIREMKFKIFKTVESTVPALGRLEIWGVPSRNVPQNIREDVFSVWKKITGITSVQGSTTLRFDEISPSVKTASSSVSDHPNLQVPEDFLDPISCEIMIVPMVLPSGNIVDLSTLEKFYKEQAKLGRGRSDPFTGVLFTDRNQPVVATSLKTRLDKFLIENSGFDLIKRLPRTLGRKALLPPSTSTHFELVQDNPTYRPSVANSAQNLDELLSGCLVGLPSYTGDPEPPKKISKPGCAECSEVLSSSEVTYMFTLTCQHILCRKCLSTLREEKKNSCPTCSKEFEFSNVTRCFS